MVSYSWKMNEVIWVNARAKNSRVMLIYLMILASRLKLEFYEWTPVLVQAIVKYEL